MSGTRERQPREHTDRARRWKTTFRRWLLKSPLTHFVLPILLLSLVQGVLVKVYQIPSESMTQTLQVGDRVLVNRLAYTTSQPRRGDVVVFRKPDSWGPAAKHDPLRTAVGWFGDLTGIGPGNTEYLVKRVIGVPGDTVDCCDSQGRVTVNGLGIDEPYIYQDLQMGHGAESCSKVPGSPRCFPRISLGADQYLVLGDHRSRSADSVIACRGPGAEAGCVRTLGREDVIGRVEWFLYPLSRWRALPYAEAD